MNTEGSETPAQAARLGPKLRQLANRRIYFGTSSWKYDGWLGSIYSQDRYLTRGKFSNAKFEQDCLSEYAETFATVCGDLTFYQFPTEQYWAKLFDATPENFVFAFKVPEDITVSTWPKHARYCRRARLANQHFLDAETLKRLASRSIRCHEDVDIHEERLTVAAISNNLDTDPPEHRQPITLKDQYDPESNLGRIP
jgi:hypothetical protein